jgi:tRNA(fMet)-specific endonuclease VapC
VTLYLLDTNHLSNAIKAVSTVRDNVQRLRRRGGVRFATCGHVVCELFVGIILAKDYEARLRRLNSLLKHVKVWQIELPIAAEYGRVRHELVRRGRVFSQTDIAVAAFARHRKATILTSDRDFEALPDIASENWLV